MTAPDQLDRWDRSKTQRLIQERLGRAQLEDAKHCLRSVDARMRHSAYHFQEAKALLRENIDECLDTEKLFNIALLVDLDGRQKLDKCLLKVEAHMIACAQAIHAIPDILSHVVYFALGLNLGHSPLKGRDVTLYKVIKALSVNPASYVAVTSVLEKLVTDTAFTALEAAVNHGKHRGVPDPVLALAAPGSPSLYSMEFGAFVYGDFHHPQREMTELLAPAFAAVSRAVVDTGNAINAVLSR